MGSHHNTATITFPGMCFCTFLSFDMSFSLRVENMFLSNSTPQFHNLGFTIFF